jgi:hypothetical protein
VSKLLRTVLFADDTTLMASNFDYDILIEQVNSELEKVNLWTRVNRLSLNVNKTFSMCFTNRNHDVDLSLPIMFNGQTVQNRTSGNFLGVILDQNLKFDSNI